MRTLTLLVTLLFTVSAMAEMPAYLKGATVTVTLKNGKKYTYKSEKMAVVPRENLGTNALKAAHFDVLHEKIKTKKLVKNRKNRVYGLIGKGLNGDLKTLTNGDRYETKHKKGTVIGFGYQRKINNKVNVGIQVQDNQTTSLSLGLDF